MSKVPACPTLIRRPIFLRRIFTQVALLIPLGLLIKIKPALDIFCVFLKLL